MKNYLAIDTSGSYLSVVAVKNGKAFSSFLPDCAMRQSALLMGEIDRVLKQAEMTLQECDFFAAVVGAGSFTGIRIGISAAKGFALACGKPTLPVTSFEVLAYNAVDEKPLCLVDAMHGYYYACGFENGVAQEPAYLSEAEVLAKARQEGYTLYAGAPLALQTKIAEPIVGLQKAVEKLSARNAFGELTAVYVRKSSAEENLQK